MLSSRPERETVGTFLRLLKVPSTGTVVPVRWAPLLRLCSCREHCWRHCAGPLSFNGAHGMVLDERNEDDFLYEPDDCPGHGRGPNSGTIAAVAASSLTTTTSSSARSPYNKRPLSKPREPLPRSREGPLCVNQGSITPPIMLLRARSVPADASRTCPRRRRKRSCRLSVA